MSLKFGICDTGKHPFSPAFIFNVDLFASGVTKAAWVGSANAAATTWLRRTWTGPAARTTARTSAATTATACAARVSARSGQTPRRGTAASSASVTTSTATALGTNCAAVSVAVNPRLLVRVFRYLIRSCDF